MSELSCYFCHGKNIDWPSGCPRCKGRGNQEKIITLIQVMVRLDHYWDNLAGTTLRNIYGYCPVPEPFQHLGTGFPIEETKECGCD